MQATYGLIKAEQQAGVPASRDVLLFFDVFVARFSVMRFFFRLVLTD